MNRKIKDLLNKYCQDSQSERFTVFTEDHGDDGCEVRAIVTSEHFSRIDNRQADVWNYIRERLSAKELLHVSAIQTLDTSEAPLPWRN